jgi:high affinity Mn2+ porin
VTPRPTTGPSEEAGWIPAIASLSGEAFGFPYSVHGQATIIPQFSGPFHSPYEGANSYADRHQSDATYTATLFFGARLFPGTEVFVNPELSGGQGVGRVVGLGDPPNGEAPRVSSAEPSPSFARIFVRETFGLGGDQEEIADGQNTIAGKQDVRRITVTAGQYSAGDIFDGNAYAHDPRGQFSNWALMDNAAWDYPADTKGYTQGVTVEYNEREFAVRYGIFREPKEANGQKLDAHLDEAFAQVLEGEYRYDAWGQPGVVRPMAYANRAHMGSYSEAVAEEGGGVPDVTAARDYRTKYGYGVSFDQAITSEVGMFARAGWNDGPTETWAFTEVDRSVSGGVSIKGTSWGRKDDLIGVGGFLSGLSTSHRDYLAAGGLGFELGDGKLNYAPEEGVEAYYLIAISSNIFLSFDGQVINHPGYNADRGPIVVGGFRFHFEF